MTVRQELLEVRSPITPGVHRLYLSIFDANDEILASRVRGSSGGLR